MDLVLLPGMNCSADLWTGCGLDAGALELTEPSLDAQVGVLLDRLPARSVLVGLSLGGIVAMALAVAAPGRVQGLCVVSSNAKGPTAAQRAGWDDWLRLLDAGQTARQLQESIAPQLLSPQARDVPELLERTLRMGDTVGEAALRAQLLMQHSRIDLRPALRRLQVPTLVVSGDRDTICPPEFHVEIAATVPAARLVTLPGGHLLPMEQPEAFGGTVRAWLGQLR